MMGLPPGCNCCSLDNSAEFVRFYFYTRLGLIFQFKNGLITDSIVQSNGISIKF